MECRLPLFGWGSWPEAMAKLPVSVCTRREGSTPSATLAWALLPSPAQGAGGRGDNSNLLAWE